MSETKIYRIDELDFPEELYPRASGKTWWAHVKRYADEMKNGAVFPPIIVGLHKGKNIVVDGWHRCQAYKMNGEEYVTAILKKYDDLRDLFADAVRYNNKHGIMLTPHDKVRIIDKLEEMKFEPFEIGEIVQASPDMIKKFSSRKVNTPRGTYYLKSSLNKLYEKNWISEEIIEGFDQSKISVRSVSELIFQLTTFIEGEAFPWEDPNLGTALAQLYNALKERFAPLLEAKTS